MTDPSTIAETVLRYSKSTVEKHIDDCPITNVVVYNDRAEVTRSAFASCLDVGELQVSIFSLTRLINPDSIRVKTLDSNCDILEVSHQNDYSSKSGAAGQRAIDEVKAKVEELQEKITELDNNLASIAAQKKFITTFAQSTVSNSGAKIADRVNIQEVTDVLHYYQQEVKKIGDESILFEREKKGVSAELDIQKRKLAELTNDHHLHHDEMKVTLFIALEAKVVGDVRLQFSYVVSNATWVPSYDIRVNSADNSLALSYFAEVTQTTGENWLDCNLLLSTSNPSIGSTPPSLPRKNVDIQNHYPGYAKRSESLYKNRMLDDVTSGGSRASFALLDEQDESFAPAANQASQLPSDFRKAGVVGTGDAGSTVFTINRKVSIDCDNKPHKVMITARSFRPQMVHYAVPSVSPHVYIQAKTKNTSQYPLLASSNVSIYLDGNFISKSALKQTSAGESFQIFIGVDPAVKVEYLPVRHEEYRKGWVSGTEVKKFTHSTILHNTKSSVIRVILAESLPRSANEKISVDLVEPAPSTLTDSKGRGIETTAQDVISNLANYSENEDPNEDTLPRDFVTKNKITNNVVWLKTLQPQEKTKIDFCYKVSWPQGSQIYEYNN